MLLGRFTSRFSARPACSCCPRAAPPSARILALLTAVAGFAIALTVFAASSDRRNAHPHPASRGFPLSVSSITSQMTESVSPSFCSPELSPSPAFYFPGISRNAPRNSLLFIYFSSAQFMVYSSVRSILPLRFLRNRHNSQIFPDRHLGFHPPRVWRNEACPLLFCRQRHGPDWTHRSLCRGRCEDHFAQPNWRSYPFSPHFQMGAFPLVFIGFAILAGMWPFHTWAPTGHVAAPTAASMLLAGVVMKLGAYGCLRVAMILFPLGLGPWGIHVLGFGSWRDVFAVLAVIGIVYGASSLWSRKTSSSSSATPASATWASSCSAL